MFNTTDYCLEGEIWKDIPNYEGLYQASSFGRVRSIDGKLTHTDRHGLRKWKGRIIKNRTKIPKPEGYKISLWKDGKPKDWLLHRVVCCAFYGMPEGEKTGSQRITVNHKDGNRYNNNIENLEWITLKENIKHAYKNGLYKNTQHEICLLIKNQKMSFSSKSEASRYIGRDNHYISNCINRGHKAYDSNKNEIHILNN